MKYILISLILCCTSYCLPTAQKQSLPNDPTPVSLVIIGAGSIGKTVVSQLLESTEQLNQRYTIDLKICGLFKSAEGISNKQGLSLYSIESFLHNNKTNSSSIEINNLMLQGQLHAIQEIDGPVIVVDTTASSDIFDIYTTTLQRHGFIVTANKKIVAGKQKNFNQLMDLGKDRLFFSATVGAGLPILSTLKRRLSTGDHIQEIQGLLSGTLGFIFSQLETGLCFSEAAQLAFEKKYFEPRPQEDLSGKDVARKALILARTIGLSVEFEDIELEPLYLPEMETLSADDFLRALSQLDNAYNTLLAAAKKENKVLRYIAKIINNKLSVKIEAVEAESPLFYLKGPDNIATIKTDVYDENPLSIQGPGAGVKVTASNVFADICEILSLIHSYQ